MATEPHRADHPATPSCCVPAGQARVAVDGLLQIGPRPGTAPYDQRARGPRSTHGQVAIPGGAYAMGDSFGEGYAEDGEGPVHAVAVSPFHIDATTVTNAAYAAFVEATGYVTEAEDLGYSAVFHLQVEAERSEILGQATGTPWWTIVSGADWRHPYGPASSVADLQDHPVVQVTWNDAQAYAAWAGRYLPTEAQWEYAARGGLDRGRFPWGDDLLPGGEWRCNIWQGEFPTTNTAEDGFVGTAPAQHYEPNAYGLHNLVGNVWEWCADWFGVDTYARRAGTMVIDPAGPAEPDVSGRRVMRGGSFLCHDSYCYRYRVAARSANTPDSASSNIGFRCATPA